jgi:release factor glutamine methyltransferase
MLADPPYLRSKDVRRWPDDPIGAIDGGADGLAVLRACLQVAASHLVPRAPLLLQVAGAAQARQIREHVRAAGIPLHGQELREVDPERAVMLLQRS